MFTLLNVDGLIIGNISCGNRNSIIPKQKPTFLTFQRAYYYVMLSIGNMAINVYYMFVYFCVNQYSGMSNKNGNAFHAHTKNRLVKAVCNTIGHGSLPIDI